MSLKRCAFVSSTS